MKATHIFDLREENYTFSSLVQVLVTVWGHYTAAEAMLVIFSFPVSNAKLTAVDIFSKHPDLEIKIQRCQLTQLWKGCVREAGDRGKAKRRCQYQGDRSVMNEELNVCRLDG